ncbi:MAG: hypothetical protein BRD45_07065 [Bacteroidetes bacterium QS_8_64_10]|nr:MAG: hypothetical protein BRD45_07065 [Bacteroidetes bacterium QS_8_64_10]
MRRYRTLTDIRCHAHANRDTSFRNDRAPLDPSLHARALTENALRAAYREAHYTLRVQGPMALGDESAPEPDVAVVRGTPRDYVDAHPTTALLVVEVSDTSFADDRTRKKRVYARAGVTEYWIVNLAEAALEVYRAPNEGGYDRRETLRPPASVSPPQADAEIAVADLLP